MADDEPSSPPATAPAAASSVSLTSGILRAIRDRVGERSVSAYLEKATQRQIERDREIHERFTAARIATERSGRMIHVLF
ncbi:hypothetical protein [Streptomyces sp. NPDC051569]|uniref:hypothetical protein n=1 Tax=Streptomyces sp. NPDC051569 TaxID=3365661 RepID=UPI003789489C